MIQIYSGNGKGKTTSAIGLAIRAVGAGMRVHFCQFLKNGTSSEIAVLEKISNINVRYCKDVNTFTFRMSDEQKEKVKISQNIMLAEVTDIIKNNSADVVILDEFFGAYNSNTIDREFAEKLVKGCPEHIELVLTGRNPAPIFCELSDYHSDIQAVRHPYNNGINARKGIEF